MARRARNATGEVEAAHDQTRGNDADRTALPRHVPVEQLCRPESDEQAADERDDAQDDSMADEPGHGVAPASAQQRKPMK
jgi:hypothetical protein